MNSDQEQNNKEKKINVEKIDSEEGKFDELSIEVEDKYKFGWSTYSEVTNGRFAMIGFLAIILIELFSQKSFLNWTGIFN